MHRFVQQCIFMKVMLEQIGITSCCVGRFSMHMQVCVTV